MSRHLSSRRISLYLSGRARAQDLRHVQGCFVCRTELARLESSLASFRDYVRRWSAPVSMGPQGKESSIMMPTIGNANDYLERWLASASLDTPWYRRVVENFREAIHPLEPPPLAVTSRPVAVKNIWGIYGCQKKSWFLSLVLQTLAVAMVFAAASSPKVRHAARQVIELYAPDLATYQPKANTIRGGGGGNDGSTVPPSQGSLPKAALRQFAPPAAVNNPHPNWAIAPSILAPPDVPLPQIALNNYGDPWSKLVASSNGSGSGAGIGTGLNGGVGPGNGAGAGPGSERGIGSGVYQIDNGVIAPTLLYKVEPEYSEEARKAMYQGTVVLRVVVDTAGRVVNPEVIRSLGLGLDEKAVEAVKKWQFRPGYKNGRPVAVVAEIEVGFRLL